jgi:hypothetical protein
MTISHLLQQQIDKALVSMKLHPQHDLTLGHRWAIWAALGPWSAGTNAPKTIGHRRRGLLAIRSVRYVIHLWEEYYLDNDLPNQILNEAEQILHGTIDIQTAERHHEAFYVAIQNLPPESETRNQNIQNIAFAALKAHTVVRADEDFDPNNIDYTLTDAAFDAYQWDPACDAAGIYANGGVWDQNSDPVKRQAFWEWWLTEGVPAVYESVKEI